MASSTPATSAKVTTVLLPRNIRARLLPKLRAWLLVPWAWRMKKAMNRTTSTTGTSVVSDQHDPAGVRRLVDRVVDRRCRAFGLHVWMTAHSPCWGESDWTV